jgi:hypothetical protein
MTIAKQAGAALLGAVLLNGPALADPAETTKAAGKDASWLFIQTASQMQFDGKALTLRNINPSMVMFTDRPARMAEAVPTATFLKHWNHGGKGSFKSAPPNAGATFLVNGKLQTATLELSQPHLDGTTQTYKGARPKGGAAAKGRGDVNNSSTKFTEIQCTATSIEILDRVSRRTDEV